MFDFPGVNTQSLAERSIFFTAQLKHERDGEIVDVGEEIASKWRLVEDSPLVLRLDLPLGWCSAQSLLMISISVQPELAFSPLKSKGMFLSYRIPLDVKKADFSIKGVAGVAGKGIKKWYELNSENLNG